jgi:hypothetical protein
MATARELQIRKLLCDPGQSIFRHVHDEEVPAFVVVVNQWGREYPGAFSLRIDRTRRLTPKRNKVRERRNITGKPVEAIREEELSPGLGADSISEVPDLESCDPIKNDERSRN